MPAAYPLEFGEDVVCVARSRQDGVTFAKDFGIYEMTLHKWVRPADIDDGNRPGGSWRSRPSRGKLARQRYYRWLACPVTDAEWIEAHRANALFDAHRDDPEFGYRFLLGEARHAGQEMAERTVWRICRTNRWWSAFGTPGRGKHKRPGPPVHDDLVERQFTAQEPNQVWLTNISEHTTREGKIYLCAVKDVFSGRIVGSWIDARMKPLWWSRHWRTPWHVGHWRASQWPDASCIRRGAVGFVPGGCSTHSTVTRWSVRWAGSVRPGTTLPWRVSSACCRTTS